MMDFSFADALFIVLVLALIGGILWAVHRPSGKKSDKGES